MNFCVGKHPLPVAKPPAMCDPKVKLNTVHCSQVSEYLKKQMVPEDGAEVSDDIKKMLESHDKLVEEIFQHEDKDKNGFISHEEFSGPKHDEL